MVVEFPKDEEGYTLDENGERVLPTEPQMSKKTGKRKVGKPKTLTDAKINKVCRFIKQGNFVKQSCISAGVNYATFRNAMAKGKKGIKPYAKWYEQVEQSKAQAETDKIEILHDEMLRGNVGVIQWWLARMHPQRWERTERIKAEVDNTQTINIVKYSDKHKDKKD